MPAGADAVVQVEDTELVEKTDDGREERRVRVRVAVQPGLDIRPIGSDMAEGEELLSVGHLLGPADIGVLAGSGYTHVAVQCRPTVTVFSSGDEVADASVPLDKLTYGKKGILERPSKSN